MPDAAKPSTPDDLARLNPFLVPVVAASAVALGLSRLSPVSLWIMLRDGWAAAAVVASATGYGLWLVRGLGLHSAPRRHQILLGVGLGLGGLALLMLAAGLLGLLHRWLWIAIVVGGVLSGLWRAGGDRIAASATAESSTPESNERPGEDLGRLRWAWLIVAGPAILALLASTLPPGMLWPEEGNGYDVLEYHLGVPREYFEAGRITYLPHNIYSNFPFNVEMLYLLTMVLRGGPIEAAFTAQLLHAVLGGLAVAAIWLAGREYGSAAGLTAGVAAASCPFMPYLSGLAYVENGVMLFAALSLSAVLRLPRIPEKDRERWALVAGLTAGLACGCKYTAAPMVFVPLVCAVWLSPHRMTSAGGSPRGGTRFRLAVVFCLGWAAAFGPWLARNATWTGNPVFPLARTVMPERAGIWSDDLAARWHEGHLPAPEDRPWPRRVQRLGNEVMASRWFGAMPVLAVGGSVAWVMRRLRQRPKAPPEPPGQSSNLLQQTPLTPCWLLLLVGIAVWLTWTHLVWRFAVVCVVPAAVIAGVGAQTIRSAPGRTGVLTGLLGAAALNLGLAADTFRDGGGFSIAEIRKEQGGDGLAWFTQGLWPWQAHVPRLNALAAEGRRVLMVGDARRFYLNRGIDYSVVFNRNPFAEAAAGQTPQAVAQWLRDREYAAVYVDWGEIRRLRRSRYGFWESVDESLFADLERAGTLRRIEEFRIEPGRAAYGTLYLVPP